MQKDAYKKLENNRFVSIILLALLLSWVLAIPFEGQILMAVAWHHKYDIRSLIYIGIMAYALGTLVSDFIVKNGSGIRKLFTGTAVLCIITSGIFFFKPSALWYIMLILAMFFGGCSFAAWSLYYVSFTPSNDRMRAAADVLIYNNILMFIIGYFVVYISYVAGLLFGILILLVTLVLVRKLPKQLDLPERVSGFKGINHNLTKGLLLLFIFIFTVSFNIGLAFQLLLPSFNHLGLFVHFYWSLPYIFSLVVIRNLPSRFNRNYLLYVAIAITGFAYIGYMGLDRSIISFIIICSLIFFAKGIFDLFWWSIIGEMLDFSSHPIRIMGGGITINALGMLIGGIIGNFVLVMQYDCKYCSTIALAMIFITLLLMPPLHKELSGILKNHIYLNQFSELLPSEQTSIIKTATIIENLTERESEIATLLMQGRTYRMISAELFLSENTVKTHIRNIYSKLHLRNKTELINMLMEKHNTAV